MTDERQELAARLAEVEREMQRLREERDRLERRLHDLDMPPLATLDY